MKQYLLFAGFATLASVSPAAAQHDANASPSAMRIVAPLPPAPAWHGKSEALIAKPNDPWITPAEASGMTQTASYAEVRAYLDRLAQASSLIHVVTIGKTSLGRDMIAVVVSKDGAATSIDKLDHMRPTILAQGGIHPGESDGTDAGLMLLRDIALRGKSGLVDKANFIFVPIFNIDGHENTSRFSRPNQRGPVEQGWRTTAQNINLNRDYIKADSPEMQAMLRLIDEVDPALYLDLHVSDGVDFAYDITFGFQEAPYSHSPAQNGWLENVLRKEVGAALTAQGHIPGPLVLAVDDRHPEQGLTLPAFPPRFSHSYGDLRHMPSVLVEDHALKPYRQRVLGAYVLLEQSLKSVSAHASDLDTAIASDKARRGPMTLTWLPREDPVRTVPFRQMKSEHFQSPISGTEEIRYFGTPLPERPYKLFGSKPGLTANPPKAYWVSVAYPEVIDRLRRHGIRMETLAQPRTITVDMIRVRDAKLATTPTENRVRVSATDYLHETHQEIYAAGSVRVPTDQPLGELAMTLLEPQSEDSFFQWGFFLDMLTQTEYIEGYVIEPLAHEMIARDPALKAEFDAKLASDPEFAKNPDARLAWFYQRTAYYDSNYLLYPVGRETGN